MKKWLNIISVSVLIWSFIIALLGPNELSAAEPEKSLLILDLPKNAQITRIESYFAGKGEERACWIDVTFKNLSETPKVYNVELLINDTYNFVQKAGKPLEPDKEAKIKFASYLLKTLAEKIYLKIISVTP